MESRKYFDYMPILKYIFNEIALILRPKTIMTDFEIALQKAFMTVLSSADVKECYFHYSQIYTVLYLYLYKKTSYIKKLY